MSPGARLSGVATRERPLRDVFLRWQCRMRRIAMRENMGRPDAAIMPTLTLAGAAEPMGRIVTVLCKSARCSSTTEMQHFFRRTHDPAERRAKAVQFFSASYYQDASEFSDSLTATLPPGSEAAAALEEAGACILAFDAFGKRFDLHCAVSRLARNEALFEATWWHNSLFNPDLHPDTIVLSFEPDWANSSATPGIAANTGAGRR